MCLVICVDPHKWCWAASSCRCVMTHNWKSCFSFLSQAAAVPWHKTVLTRTGQQANTHKKKFSDPSFRRIRRLFCCHILQNHRRSTPMSTSEQQWPESAIFTESSKVAQHRRWAVRCWPGRSWVCQKCKCKHSQWWPPCPTGWTVSLMERVDVLSRDN